jgi:hypothetical protein
MVPAAFMLVATVRRSTLKKAEQAKMQDKAPEDDDNCGPGDDAQKFQPEWNSLQYSDLLH